MTEKKKKKEFLKADEQDDSLIEKNRVGDWKSLLSLLRYAKIYQGKYIGALSVMFLSTICAISSARFMGDLVDEGLLKGDYDSSWKFACYILALEVGSLFFIWYGRRILTWVSSLTILNIRSHIFSHLQNLPLGYYDRQPQGRIVTRITHDVEGIETFFTASLGRLVNAGFMAVISMTAMLLTDLRLGAILIATMIPAVIFITLTREMVRKANRKMSRLSSQLNSKLSEYVNGIDVIRAYGLEGWSKKQYDNSVEDHLNSQLNANFLFGWSRPLISFLCTMPIVGLVWFGGKDVLAGTLSVGLFVTFIRYCERFFMPIMMLAREIHVVQQAFTNSERVNAFLMEEEESVTLGEDGVVRTLARNQPIKGVLEFNNVNMKYDEDGDWVLRGVNFKVSPGEKIGLVGTTGCGKTTTVSLISRLYEFQEGEILLDEISLRDYERNFLRDSIGFVSQDAILFRGSLQENLDPGGSKTIDEVLYSCDTTGLSKVMKKSNLTLESEILEGGSNLSTGERQLLSLTRILLKNPSILILDEATANIDPGYEKIIHAAVDNVMEGRTCLMIAHRLDTLKSCDRILVFEKGEIVEEGSEEELYGKKGHFFQLHNMSSTSQTSL
jgi:ATP-binding cassette subfamily B multidrug efflux pump